MCGICRTISVLEPQDRESAFPELFMVGTSNNDKDVSHVQLATMKRASDSAWTPKAGAFAPLHHFIDISAKGSLFRPPNLIVRRPLLTRLTKDIIETYRICNLLFKYSEALKPKRFLTTPSVGVQNDGYDNVDSDLILSVNFVLVKNSHQRYIVKEILGQGTFGQVAKCETSETNHYVAVKIIKNLPAYYQQALVEVSIVAMLNSKLDPHDSNHIVRMLDYFIFRHHLCITFELLGSNLFELIKLNSFKGLPLSIIKLFSKQILDALVVMKEASIIHCDLKPENILISTSSNSPEIKIIDFGSACLEDRTVYSYIQSRYYRSPEVLLGLPYTAAIDMWSFGCIVAELFLGLPLFPGASEFDLLKRMIDTLREQPPDHILRVANNTHKFFKSSQNFGESDPSGAVISFKLLSEEEYEAREKKKPVIGKQYFNFASLEDIIKSYPYHKSLSEEEVLKENITRLALADFLRGLVEFDPVKRWSPSQAIHHPFVTGEPFSCPYKPFPETCSKPVTNTVRAGQRPGGQQWFPTGLSPQAVKVNSNFLHGSPNKHTGSFAFGSSFINFGSYGSVNEGFGAGNSYGSCDDNPLRATIMGSTGMTLHAQGSSSILGASPDAGRIRAHFRHASGFGLSSSTVAAGIRPMSLGTSPTQFTPPSQEHFTPGSPGKYVGPASPIRNSGVHGSPLSKVSIAEKFSRKSGLACSPGTLSVQQEDNIGVTCQWVDRRVDCSNFRLNDGNDSGYPSSSRGVQQSKFIQAGIRNQKEFSENMNDSRSTPPDPGDWDPNYSDELLLQNDVSEISDLTSEIVNGIHISKPPMSTLLRSRVGWFDHGSNQPHKVGASISHRRRLWDGPMHEIHASGQAPHFSQQPVVHGSMPYRYLVPQSYPSRFSQHQQHPSFPFPNHNQVPLTFLRDHIFPGCGTASPFFMENNPESGQNTRGEIHTINLFPSARKDC